MKTYWKILSLGLCSVMLLSMTACKKDQEGSNTSGSSDTASSSVSSVESNKPEGTYFDTDVWKAVPMVSKQALSNGQLGGEGCQWQLSIELDPVDGKLAFFGTDVGGIYKSTDGGKTWASDTIGMLSCGATGIKIDPNNTKRVIAVGCNSSASDKNGLYLSTDAGETWKQTFSAKIAGYRDYRKQVAFDASSKDSKIGGSKIIYWSREGAAGYNNKPGYQIAPGLYKSEDGGQSWNLLPNSAQYGHSEIAVNPSNGTLYIANKQGFFKSTDGGKTFKSTLSGDIRSMDVINSRANDVYIVKPDGMYVSTNAGDSFQKVSQSYPFTHPMYLRVSPADPNRVLLQDDWMDAGNADNSKLYYSSNGGKTWQKTDKGNDPDKKQSYRWPDGTWIPYCVRQNPTTWHPTDKNVALTFGGDFVMRSTDGGKSFHWSNDGYTGMMTGGLAVFNVDDPDLMINPSQDYNGGYTTDGGKSWTYVQWYEDWGGFTYGGYIIDKNTMFVGLKDGMDKYKGGKDVKYIAITYDGGKKTQVMTQYVINGADVGMGVPGDKNIAFMGEWRTTDKGKTWSKMTNCTGVFTYDTDKGTLFGSNGYYLVKSDDKGKTWTKIATPGEAIRDIAYNPKTKTVYVLGGGSLNAINVETKKRKVLGYGSNGYSVAVDPTRPEIIYVASRNGPEQNTRAFVRSLDGGETWTNLTRSVGDGRKGPDGGKEASSVRVNPKTGEVFVATCCRGLWKLPAPPKSK